MFLALVIPVGGGHVDNSLPGNQPGVMPPLFPSNPISPGGPPPGIWAPTFPSNPIAPGGQPPGPSQGPGFPSNPIAPGGSGGGGGLQGHWAWSPIYGPVWVPGPHLGMRPPGGGGPGVDNTLPGSQPGVDNTLPGAQPGGPRPDNTLPPSAQPKK